MSHPFELLAAEVNILANVLRKSTAELHRDDLLPSGALQVLQLLNDKGPLTVPALGSLRVTSRQNIQVTVNRLVQRGLVEANENPRHKRSVLVTLTPAGTQCLEEAERRKNQRLAQLADRIPEGETAAATEFLKKLREILTAAPQREPKTGSKVNQAMPRMPEPAAATKTQVPELERVEYAYNGPQELPVSLL